MTESAIKVGDRVTWPNGRYGRYGNPLGFQTGTVIALNDGIGGKCLKVLDDRGGHYYPRPQNVKRTDA